MTARNLEEVLRSAGDVVELLRNQQTGPNVYPGVPAEYTNWRDEVRAWQQSCVLFNQSYHMVDLAVEGPDAFAMLNHLGVNSFANFTVDKAIQMLANRIAVLGGLADLGIDVGRQQHGVRPVDA